MIDFHGIHSDRWFRSAPMSPGFSPENIDAEAGVIRDVVMVQEGPAKGHGVHLDADFISAITAYDRQHFSRIGLKARFGHPSASSETMGTQMGVFSNFRKREKDGKMQAIADLKLLDSAEVSPTHPGMRSWVLGMAAERPDFIMSSIVFRGSGYFQRKGNGNKHRLEIDQWGDVENYKEEYGPVYVEFDEEGGAQHFYTDLVEEGAATENLFSTRLNPDLLVSRAHQWLDDNPDIRDFVQKNPERVRFFLMRLGISIPTQQPTKMSKYSLVDWLLGKSPDAEPNSDDLKSELATAQKAVTALQTEKETLENRVQQLSTQVDALQANVDTLKSDAEALKADITAKNEEIERLKSEKADDHTGGRTTAPAGSGERAYQKNPIYQHARRISGADNSKN